MKKIQILGMGCAKCEKLYEAVEEAAKELGIEYEMEKINDINKISDMGVMATPALVVNGKVMFSAGILTKEVLKEILSK